MKPNNQVTVPVWTAWYASDVMPDSNLPRHGYTGEGGTRREAVEDLHARLGLRTEQICTSFELEDQAVV
jgi:hypothetical protein